MNSLPLEKIAEATELSLEEVRALQGEKVGLMTLEELTSLIGRSAFISERHLAHLRESAVEKGLDVERAVGETDGSTDMEGLYIKVKKNGVVEERYKYVRVEFLGAVESARGHWLNRPIIPNQFAPGANIFGASV